MHGGYSSAQSTNFATIGLTAKEEDLAQELQALAEERDKFAEATTRLERYRVALEVSKRF